MSRQYLNPEGLPDWSGLFSQVVVVEGASRLVFFSGQVGVLRDQILAGDGSFEAQADQALHNVQTALHAAGAAWKDVVKLTVFVVGYRAEHGVALGPLLRARFAEGRLPALSLVGVAALARPEWRVEIEGTAVLGA